MAYTNHAVTLLCGAMSEVAKRVGLGGGRHVSRLEGLVHGAESSGRVLGSGQPPSVAVGACGWLLPYSLG